MESSKFSEDSPYCNPSMTKIVGISEPRKALPLKPEGYKPMDLSKLMTLMKTIIGKDLSKFSLPVFLNEPLSILQKSAEFLCFADLFEEAVTEPCPFRRMVLVSTFAAATQWFVVNRTSKPFISMLGETFEIVTDKFQYYGENVSQ